MARWRGDLLFSGSPTKASESNFVPHHGHTSSGTGGASPNSGRLLFRLRLALIASFIEFGVALRPTQMPTEKRLSPRFSTSRRRSSSIAHVSCAARLSWSRVSSLSV